MAQWNLNGWTEANKELRTEIILSLNADIISCNETHLKDDTVLHMDGYTWFGYNRQYQHVRELHVDQAVLVFWLVTIL